MKKIIALLLVLILCSASSLAAGKLSVTKENFHVLNGYSVYAYVFAKVENIGDKPIEVKTGLFEVYDSNGDVLNSSDYMSTYPSYLQPGEVGYVSLYTDIKQGTPDDYSLTVGGKSNNESVSTRLQVEVSYEKDVPYSKYSSYDYMFVKVTNNTDHTVFNAKVAMALLDDEENIMLLEYKTLYDIGILPGESVVVREQVSSSWNKHFEENGQTPTHMDAIAFIE